MRSDEEAVLALPCAPERVPIAHHVRGTVVVCSQRSLASRKLLQAYERALEPAFRDELKGVIASSWVPIDAALAHYAAADALGLDLKTMDYAFGAFITGVAAPLCTRAYARVLTDRCTPTRVAYRVSWA